MENSENIEEHQEYISGPYVALINGISQQREPNKKLKNILIASLVTITLVLIITISIYLLNNRNEKIDNIDPGNQIDSDNEEYIKLFENFKKIYNKKYASKEEEMERFEIFKQNLNYIRITNKQGFSYELEMNEFGDLKKDEFINRYTGYKKVFKFDEKNEQFRNRLLTAESNSSENEMFNFPKSVNWLEAGCVNPVRNQKNCGSCWAFSAIAALEGAMCVQLGKKLPSLSEQQLVDCTRGNGNNGCGGGTMGMAFQYAIDNKYLCTSVEYPYKAGEDECSVFQCKNMIEVPIYSYKYVLPRTPNMLKRALAEYGPISVAIQADQTPFQFYKRGVFDAPCGTKINHGVVLVGYDFDYNTNKEYWLVRNSWGEGWGESGYIKLALHSGKKGTCGILIEPVYPILKS
ncbi:cryptopain precursor [Cryptosporidium xiaoi]|uniref:Cryptopain n=1 Tax=Cryptosporidium xiaoi TaxID=659607 RepID=A0AAV9XYS4_9CRYT